MKNSMSTDIVVVLLFVSLLAYASLLLLAWGRFRALYPAWLLLLLFVFPPVFPFLFLYLLLFATAATAPTPVIVVSGATRGRVVGHLRQRVHPRQDLRLGREGVLKVARVEPKHPRPNQVRARA